jgi:predicted phage terminase large subunit-like protein
MSICYLPADESSKWRLTWLNGAVASIYNGTEPDQLRGPQQDATWCDELAKWQYAREAWDQLQFGLRTGKNPEVCITTAPRPIQLLKQIIADPGTVVTRGSTFDSRGNLAEKFLHTVRRKYEGTRLGRPELEAELLEDLEGALWKRSEIEAFKGPGMPIAAAGIVCAGLGDDDHAYILDDVSGVMAPNEWAKAAISLLRERMGDRIIAETNNGGEMVENTLRMVDPSVPYSAVWASRGKVTRAEPISALYEQGRVHHVGAFPRLEDQMCAFTVDFDRRVMGDSPDRVDALVWALTELVIDAPPGRRLLVA